MDLALEDVFTLRREHAHLADEYLRNVAFAIDLVFATDFPLCPGLLTLGDWVGIDHFLGFHLFGVPDHQLLLSPLRRLYLPIEIVQLSIVDIGAVDILHGLFLKIKVLFP